MAWKLPLSWRVTALWWKLPWCFLHGMKTAIFHDIVMEIAMVFSPRHENCHFHGISRPNLFPRPYLVSTAIWWFPRPNGQMSFVTFFAIKWSPREREYPQGFCEAYAAAVQKATAGKDSIFLEVFSGPNAPLSKAVATVWGLQPPAPLEALPKGSECERSETETSVPKQVAPPEAP